MRDAALRLDWCVREWHTIDEGYRNCTELSILPLALPVKTSLLLSSTTQAQTFLHCFTDSRRFTSLIGLHTRHLG
jgi:hypothetical protein